MPESSAPPAPPALPAGTVTFLFTDLEGSTALLQACWRFPPEAALPRAACAGT